MSVTVDETTNTVTVTRDTPATVTVTETSTDSLTVTEAAANTVEIQTTRGLQGIQGATGPAGPSAALNYSWSTNTANSDPGAGYVKVNGLITGLYISETDRNSNDVSDFFPWIQTGHASTEFHGYVLVQNSDGADILGGEIVDMRDNGGWWDMTLSNPLNAGLPNADEDVAVLIVPSGRVISGGGTGALLRKASGTDYDVEWSTTFTSESLEFLSWSL